MADDDFIFGFDTTFFDKGIEKVTKGLTGLQTTTQSVAKGVSKGLTSVALKFGSVFAGVKAVQGALKNMPEVGQAFGIAKDVFLKNLLFPLRKEVFPLLQKMLDWVRDSRGMFVRWGQSVANVFRGAVSGIRTVITFMREMTEKISGYASKIFGDRIKSINDLFNLVSFKLSVVIQFIASMASQLSGFVGNLFKDWELEGVVTLVENLAGHFRKIFDFVTKMTGKFLEGFIPAIKDMFDPINRIVEAWQDIFDLIFGSTEQMDKWGGIFESLGSFLGGAFMTTLDILAAVVEGIKIAVIEVQDAISAFKNEDAGLFDKFGAFFGTFGEKSSRRVNDAIIRPDGSVIETHPDDTLIATKSPVLQAVPATNNTRQNIFNMDISPTIVLQRGNESEGRAVAVGLVEQLRLQFNQEFERGGY